MTRRAVVALVLLGSALFASAGWAQAREASGERAGASGTQAPPYNPEGKRDPFRPFTFDFRRSSQPEGELTPLQRYDLGQLTVVGTIWQGNPPRAMIEDAQGMGFIVTVGTPIGRNGGVVAAIEPRRVVVEEKLLDFYGNEQVNRVVMEIPSEEGGSSAGRERR